MTTELSKNEIIIPCNIEKCKWISLDNGYCKRHQRVYQYNQLISSGKNLCRFFFRGCNNEIDKETKTCKDCINKKHIDKKNCGHEGCKNYVKGTEYCGKHIRDIYYDRQIEEGIKFCDIARGCFTVCDEGFASCKECLEKSRKKENKVFINRKKLNIALKELNSTDKSICVDCGNEFNKFLTKYNKESKRCMKCNETQKKQDAKRQDRMRNYKEESMKNKSVHYNHYIKGAIKRNLAFELTFEQFSDLILKECYYCNHKINTEVNGIDRVNNSLGYTLENCVPCCEVCNRMKFIYDPEYFIEKCKFIANKEPITIEFIKKWNKYYTNTQNKSYINYKKNAEEERKLEFKIEKDDWDKLIKSPCYLCGFRKISGIGIDRVDNTIRKYTLDNCKPCCGSCNLMKGDISLDVILEKCKIITEKWKGLSKLKTISLKQKDIKSVKPPTIPRQKWTAKGLYNAIQSDTYKDFLEINKHILTEEELEIEVLAIQQFETFEDAKKYLQTFLNKLNVRRKRYK
jgi:hypothetical protein